MKQSPTRRNENQFFCCFILFLFSTSAVAQYVVPNSGFELFTTCPGSTSQFDPYVNDWINPTNGSGSPDYLNSCAATTVSVPDNSRGFQYAHSGNAYCGIVIARGNYNQNFREYIEVQFTNTLEADSCYHFEMFFNLANISQFNSDAIQVYISDTLVSGITNPYPLPFTPQISNPAGNFPDSVNWSVISGDYTASGSENFMIIGNFFDSLNSTLVPFNSATGSNVAFVFIDDVSFTKVPCAISAGFVAAENNICPGTCIDFTNLSAGATGYIWSFPGGSPASSTSANPANICYAAPGNYNVQLIASNANGSDTLLLTNYITVYPSPPPQSITQSGDTLFAISGSASYQWYYNTNIINGATNYFYVAQASGDYNVVATDANGCEVEAVIFNVLASAQFKEESLKFEVYPNPVGDKVIIQKSHPDTSPTSSFWRGYRDTRTASVISVYNLLGEMILTVQPHTSGFIPITIGTETSIDVSELTPGLYYIEIVAGEKIFRSKFVKQ